MATSAAYERIRSDVLAMAAAIPAGCVSTYTSLAAHIDVMPRHVAYLLATLDDAERELIPWHRVMGNGGKLSTANKRRLSSQTARLAEEGIIVAAGRVIDFESVFVDAASLQSGIAKKCRPA